MFAAQHFIVDRGVCDRRAEVISGFNRGRYFFTEHDRLGRSFYFDFKLRLFVFLHAKSLAAVNAAAAVRNAVDAQGGIGSQF